MSKIPSVLWAFLEPCAKPGEFAVIEMAKSRGRLRGLAQKAEGKAVLCQRIRPGTVKGKRGGKTFIWVVWNGDTGEPSDETFCSRKDAEEYASYCDGKVYPYKFVETKSEKEPRVTEASLVTKSLHAAGRMAVAVNSFLYKPTGKNVEDMRESYNAYDRAIIELHRFCERRGSK
jgi:hypothetical protein